MACYTLPSGQPQSTGSGQSAQLASTGGTSPVGRGEGQHRGPECAPQSQFNLAHTHPAHLAELGKHYDNSGVVLPQGTPEVLCGLCQWTLRCNVGFLLSAVGKGTGTGSEPYSPECPAQVPQPPGEI